MIYIYIYYIYTLDILLENVINKCECVNFNIIILTGSTGSQVPLVEEIPKYWFKLLISSFPSFPEELSEYSGFMCSAGLCGLIMRRRETSIPNLSSVRFLVLNTALCLSFLAMIQGLKDGFSWSLQLYSEQRPQWIIHYRLWERVRMKFTFSVELFILGPSPAGVHWLGFFLSDLSIISFWMRKASMQSQKSF